MIYYLNICFNRTSQASTSNYGTPERYNGANSTDELSVTAKVLTTRIHRSGK